MASESDSHGKCATSSEREDPSKRIHLETAPGGTANMRTSPAHQSATSPQTPNDPQNPHHGIKSNTRRSDLPPIGIFKVAPQRLENRDHMPPDSGLYAFQSNVPPSMGPYNPPPGPPVVQHIHSGNALPNPRLYSPSLGTPFSPSVGSNQTMPPQSIHPEIIGRGYLPPSFRPHAPPPGTFTAPLSQYLAAIQPSNPPRIAPNVSRQDPRHRLPPMGTFSAAPPFGKIRNVNLTILHPSYLDALLNDVETRAVHAQAIGHGRPRFMAIIDGVMTHHAQNRGSMSTFYSREHAKHGDDWLKWMVVGRLKNVLLIRMAHGDALGWEEEGVNEALGMMALAGEMGDRFRPREVVGEDMKAEKSRKRGGKGGKVAKKGKKVGGRVLGVRDLFPVPAGLEQYISEESECGEDGDDGEPGENYVMM